LPKKVNYGVKYSKHIQRDTEHTTLQKQT